MTKTCKIPNKLHSDSVFWIFGFEIYLSLSLFRISIFGFRILIRWRPFDFAQDMLGAIDFLEVVVLNISWLKI